MRITKEECKMIREQVESGQTQKSIAEHYGVDPASISYHVNGKCSHNDSAEDKKVDDDGENNNQSSKSDSVHDLSIDELVKQSNHLSKIGEDSENGEEIVEYSLFKAISASRRRSAILVLDEIGGTITTSKLADHIAEIEHSNYSSEERKRIYVGLYQTHLEKLDDAQVIEYNKDRNTITPNQIVSDISDFIKHGIMLSSELGDDSGIDKVKRINEEGIDDSSIDSINQGFSLAGQKLVSEDTIQAGYILQEIAELYDE